MSSDKIHDVVLCAERRVRTPARSIDAAIVKESAYGCDCRLPNGIYRHNLPHDKFRAASETRSQVCSPDKRKQPDAFEFLPGCSQRSGRDPISIPILAAPCFAREYDSQPLVRPRNCRAVAAALRSAAVAAKRRICRTRSRASTERA